MERVTLSRTAAVIALLLATVFVYAPGLAGPYVFDDLTNIVYVSELHIKELSLDALRNAATAVPQGPLGRPLAYVSFALNHYFTGLDPFFFKLTNVFIHAFTALALFGLGYLVVRRLQVLGYGTHTRPWLLSLIVSAVWALHPINLTAVLYVVQRMTSLASLFLVLSLIGYIIGREQLLKGQKRGFATILATLAIFGSMALLTKENGVLYFAYALVIEFTLYRLKGADRLQSSTRRFLLALFAIPAVAAIAIVTIYFENIAGSAAYTPRPFTLHERLLTEARALWFYVRLIVVPDISHLGLYHDDFTLSQSLLRPISTVFAVIGIVATILIALIFRRRQPVLTFGVMWFLGGHLLESTIIPLELVHEHRNYLPSFGVLFAAVYYAEYAGRKLGKRSFTYGFIGLYAALLGSGTYTRANHWASEWNLYHKEAANHPNSSRARSMLGILYHDNKLYPAAEHEFRMAVRLNPTSPDPLIRLAQHQFVAKNSVDREVLAELERALKTLPLNSVTLHVIDPFIKLTVTDRRLSKEVLQMYAATLKRQDIHINPAMLAVAAANTALAYMKIEEFSPASDLYAFAIRQDSRPLYIIGFAEAELRLGHATIARMALRGLDNTALSDDERRRLKSLKQQLATRGSRSQ